MRLIDLTDRGMVPTAPLTQVSEDSTILEREVMAGNPVALAGALGGGPVEQRGQGVFDVGALGCGEGVAFAAGPGVDALLQITTGRGLLRRAGVVQLTDTSDVGVARGVEGEVVNSCGEVGGEGGEALRRARGGGGAEADGRVAEEAVALRAARTVARVEVEKCIVDGME